MTYHDACSPLPIPLFSISHLLLAPTFRPFTVCLCAHFPFNPLYSLLSEAVPFTSSPTTAPPTFFTSFQSARRTSTLAIASRSAVVQASTTSSAPHFRQITTPEPHHLIFYRLDARPDAHLTVSKHWRHKNWRIRPGLNWGPFTC